MVCIIYIASTKHINDDFTIIQLPLRSLTDDVILERNPIVISDSIVDCEEFISITFRYMYIKKTNITPNALFTINPYQYLIVHVKSDVNEVTVTHPKTGVSTIIKLYPGNILILPWQWKYNIKNKSIQLIGLHSLTTLFL